MATTASNRALTLIFAAIMATGAAPASAAGTPIGFSKSDAILGGAPSQLQLILAAQRGLPAAGQSASFTPIRPASYVPAPMIDAVVRNAPQVRSAVDNGRPDVFGTVALRVGHTPLDARWHRVDHSPVSGAPAAYAEGLRGLAPADRLEAVNRYVNRHIRFTDDQVQYGRPDVWSPASQTLSRGRGDCEDYAIAKLQMLRTAGIAERDLYLVIVKDLVRRADHAVLVVRSQGRMLLLDNGTDRLLDTDSVEDYRPVLSFSASGTWTHGYVRPSLPAIMASATPIDPLSPSSAE